MFLCASDLMSGQEEEFSTHTIQHTAKDEHHTTLCGAAALFLVCSYYCGPVSEHFDLYYYTNNHQLKV